MDKRKGITLFDKSVSKFKTLIKSGPVFMLYVIVVVVICNTCDKALQNSRMPCQAVANRLFVEDLPKQFQGINWLE